MKDHVEIGHLTKYYALRVDRDRVMNFAIKHNYAWKDLWEVQTSWQNRAIERAQKSLSV